jgi:hypothetical protein
MCPLRTIPDIRRPRSTSQARYVRAARAQNRQYGWLGRGVMYRNCSASNGTHWSALPCRALAELDDVALSDGARTPQKPHTPSRNNAKQRALLSTQTLAVQPLTQNPRSAHHHQLPRHGRGHWFKSSIAHSQKPLRLQGFLCFLAVRLTAPTDAKPHRNPTPQTAFLSSAEGWGSWSEVTRA